MRDKKVPFMLALSLVVAMVVAASMAYNAGKYKALVLANQASVPESPTYDRLTAFAEEEYYANDILMTESPCAGATFYKVSSAPENIFFVAHGIGAPSINDSVCIVGNRDIWSIDFNGVPIRFLSEADVIRFYKDLHQIQSGEQHVDVMDMQSVFEVEE